MRSHGATTAQPKHRNPWSLRRSKALLNTTAATTSTLSIAALTAAIIWRPHAELPIVPEKSVFLEPIQPFAWLAAATLAAAATLTNSTRRGTLLALWIAVFSTIAGLRELDLHAAINPEHAHHLGIAAENAVRFRLDWWLHEGPLLPRLIWAAVFLAAFAAAVLPFALARYPWPTNLIRFDRFAILITLGLAAAALGFVIDDLARTLPPSLKPAAATLEESVELLSPLFIIAAAHRLATHRLSLRHTNPTPLTKHTDQPHNTRAVS